MNPYALFRGAPYALFRGLAPYALKGQKLLAQGVPGTYDASLFQGVPGTYGACPIFFGRQPLVQGMKYSAAISTIRDSLRISYPILYEAKVP